MHLLLQRHQRRAGTAAAAPTAVADKALADDPGGQPLGALPEGRVDVQVRVAQLLAGLDRAGGVLKQEVPNNAVRTVWGAAVVGRGKAL